MSAFRHSCRSSRWGGGGVQGFGGLPRLFELLACDQLAHFLFGPGPGVSVDQFAQQLFQHGVVPGGERSAASSVGRADSGACQSPVRVCRNSRNEAYHGMVLPVAP